MIITGSEAKKAGIDTALTQKDMSGESHVLSAIAELLSCKY